MTEDPWKAAVQCLNFRISALEELLDVYEKTVIEQTEKLFREKAECMRMEGELLASEGRLNAIIEGSPLPLFVIDTDHRVIYWNKAMEKYSGIGAAEMLGTNRHWQAFYPEQRSCLADLLVFGREDEIPLRYAEKYRRSMVVEGAFHCVDFFPKLGEQGAWMNFTATVIRDCNGALIGAVEMFEDITEERRAQEELEKYRLHLEELVAERTIELKSANERLLREIAERIRAEAEVRMMNDELEKTVEDRTTRLLEAREELVRKEKLATIGRLAGCVGHELRNPLGVMNNAVYFLETVLPDADGTVREYLGIIRNEIDASQRIITDLLDFARTRKPEGKTMAVRDLVEKSLAGCALPENIGLKTEIPDNLPPLRVDPLQIGQVLQNLIMNGTEAMPGGGTLKIAARLTSGSRFEVPGSRIRDPEPDTATDTDTDTDTAFMEISIEDSGEGISPENMKNLFQPLFTTKARGIGLGLTVCRNLTEANGGRIGVVSRPGEGTVFTLTLPAGEGAG